MPHAADLLWQGKKRACLLEAKPFCLFEAKPFCLLEAKPFCLFEAKPFCLLEEKPFCLFEAKPFCLLEEKPFCLLEKKPFCLLEEKPFCLFEAKPFCLLEAKPFCLLEEKPFCLLEAKPFHVYRVRCGGLWKETTASPLLASRACPSRGMPSCVLLLLGCAWAETDHLALQHPLSRHPHCAARHVRVHPEENHGEFRAVFHGLLAVEDAPFDQGA